jgi:hypothetical protein
MKKGTVVGSDGRKFWDPDTRLKVLKSFHTLAVSGKLPKRAEEAWKAAQEHGIPKADWRPFNTSAQASAMMKHYREAVEQGLITNVPAVLRDRFGIYEPEKKSHHAHPKVQQEPVEAPPPPEPVAVEAAAEPPIQPEPTPSQIQPGDLKINGQIIKRETYDAILQHHEITHPPRRPSLDEAFGALIDDRLNSLIGSRLTAMVKDFENRISELAQAFDLKIKATDERLAFALNEGNKNIQSMFHHQGEAIKAAMLESNVKIMQWLDPTFNLPDDKRLETPNIDRMPVSETPPAKKLRVLLAGGEPRLGNSIKERFPNIELVHYIQNGLDSRRLDADFDLVVGSRWMSHSMAARLQNAYGDKYVHVPQGAITALASTIQKHLPQAVQAH